MSDEPDDECIHGMYPKTSCTICTKKPQDKNDIQYEFTNQYTLGCYE